MQKLNILPESPSRSAKRLTAIVIVLGASVLGCEQVPNPAEPMSDEVAEYGYRESDSGERSGFGTATIDGALNSEEWSPAAVINVEANLPWGGTAPATIYVMNDDTNIYFAMSAQTTGFEHSSFVVEMTAPFRKEIDIFSPDFFGDALVYNPTAAPYFFDNFRHTEGNTSYGTSDTRDGGTSDGSGAFGQLGGTSVWEMAHPLNSGDEHDLCITNRALAIQFMLRFCGPGPCSDTFYPRAESWAQSWIPVKTSHSGQSPGQC